MGECCYGQAGKGILREGKKGRLIRLVFEDPDSKSKLPSTCKQRFGEFRATSYLFYFITFIILPFPIRYLPRSFPTAGFSHLSTPDPPPFYTAPAKHGNSQSKSGYTHMSLLLALPFLDPSV